MVLLRHGSRSPKIREFVTFVALIYFKWWATCSRATDSPWNDLTLYKDILRYAKISEPISDSAREAFKRHSWYLTAEMVPLALFSELVPDSERRGLADKLIELKPDDDLMQNLPKERFGTGFGKPTFPADIKIQTKLADLVTEDSWFMFRLLDLDSDFLLEDVDKWDDLTSFMTSKCKARSLNVTNDAAERAVKLSTDFLQSARTEEKYQSVLQVVEQDRKWLPNLRKRKSKS